MDLWALSGNQFDYQLKVDKEWQEHCSRQHIRFDGFKKWKIS